MGVEVKCHRCNKEVREGEHCGCQVPYPGGTDARSILLTTQEHRMILNLMELNPNHENAALRKKVKQSLERMEPKPKPPPIPTERYFRESHKRL